MGLSSRLEPLFKRAEKQAAQDYAYFKALGELYLTEDPTLDQRAFETADYRRQMSAELGLGSAMRAFEVLGRDADDEDVSLWAERRSRAVAKMVARQTDAWEIYAQARNYAGLYGIDAPTPVEPGKRGATMAGCIRKLMCPKFWKRAVRRMHARKWEALELQAGRVHVKGQPCASDFAVKYVRNRRESNAQMMLGLWAVNEQGAEVCLGDAMESSTANPTIRRMEMMARLKGMETVALDKKHPALFVSWTLASRWHRYSFTGSKVFPNPRYDGTSTPRDGQKELAAQWKRVRAALNKKGIKTYGFRCAEPHHDGTPHWHMVLFVEQKEHLKELRAAISAQALKESPGEPGAQRVRVNFKTINYAKGSATAYMAKYVAKNVDGAHLDHAATPDDAGQMQFAGTDPIAYAERVTAWARVWGARQFQFFGLPPVTTYRELRRIREVQIDLPLIEPIRAAADSGDVSGYITRMGGPLVTRTLQTLSLLKKMPAAPQSTLTSYLEYRPQPTQGVQHNRAPEILTTRLHTWTIETRTPPDGTVFSGPWTRVNNCNRASAPDLTPPEGKPHEPYRSDPRKWPISPS